MLITGRDEFDWPSKGMWIEGEVKGHVDRLLSGTSYWFLLKRHCLWLKGIDHLFDHLVEEHAGQLRVLQERLEFNDTSRDTGGGKNMLANCLGDSYFVYSIVR